MDKILVAKARSPNIEINVFRKKPSDPVTIESVKENWSKVIDMTDAKYINRIAEVTLDLVEKLTVRFFSLIPSLVLIATHQYQTGN